MNEGQWFFYGVMIVWGLWMMYMATFKTKEWNEYCENDWRRKKEFLGGVAKVGKVGLGLYLGRKW